VGHRCVRPGRRCRGRARTPGGAFFGGGGGHGKLINDHQRQGLADDLADPRDAFPGRAGRVANAPRADRRALGISSGTRREVRGGGFVGLVFREAATGFGWRARPAQNRRMGTRHFWRWIVENNKKKAAGAGLDRLRRARELRRGGGPRLKNAGVGGLRGKSARGDH